MSCPIHRQRRHPRICRFCRSDKRYNAPPLAPSECPGNPNSQSQSYPTSQRIAAQEREAKRAYMRDYMRRRREAEQACR